MTPQSRSEHMTALFLFGALALSPPFLAIFGVDVLFFGVPLLYFYLFATWALLIGLLAFVSRSGAAEDADPRRPPDDA